MKKAHILISRGLAVIGDTKPVLDLVKAAPTDSGIVEFNGVKYSFGFTYRDQLRKPIPESEATWETYRVLTVRREDEND